MLTSVSAPPALGSAIKDQAIKLFALLLQEANAQCFREVEKPAT